VIRPLLLRWLVGAAVGALVLGFAPLYGALTAPGRLSPGLAAALREHRPSYSVVVLLPFPPQNYNITTLQHLGTLAGSSGSAFTLLDLPAATVKEIAGFYWVKEVRLLHGPHP
jgi:hypothetical protein